MAKIITIPQGSIIYDIDIEIHKPVERPTVYTKQYDSNTRFIVAKVYNDGEQYILTTSDTIHFACTKPDGFGIDNECGIDTEGRIIYKITDQTSAKDGQFPAEFRIYSTYKDELGNDIQQLKTTANIKMWVDKSTLNNSTIISSDEANVLTALIGDATKAISDTNAATSNAINAINTINQLNTDIINSENIRNSNENTRISNESTRESAENTRISNENTRKTNEESRVNAESSRVVNENTRTGNESTRESQESTRQSNETIRQNQEVIRQEYYNAYKVCEAYDNLKAYVIGNKVTYQGSTYQNILASTGILPTNTTNWILIAAKGIDGVGGDMKTSIYDTTGRNTDIFAYADNKIGDLTKLPTDIKTDLVSSIMEVDTKKLSTNGDSSNNTVAFSEATLDEDIVSGDTHATLFSKIKKRLANILLNLANKFDKSNIANNLSTTAEGLALDARQGKVLNDLIGEINNNLANKLDSSSYAGSYNSVGWYRVAEYTTTAISSARGADCNSVNISIKRNYNNENNEYYSLLLMSIYNKSVFIKIGKLSNSQRITKIRHTVDTINLKAYLEIYYSYSLFNNIAINLFDVKDGTGRNKWNTITPVATSETVSGVEVFSTMDLTTA